MEDWGEIARPVMRINFWWGLYFIFYLSVSGCAILNLIVGVVCDKTMEAARDCQEDDDADERKAQVIALQRLHETLMLLDANGDGNLTKDELLEGYENQSDVGMLLNELEVPQPLAEMVFYTLDKGKDVRCADFIDGIMLVKGLRNGHKDTAEISALVPRLTTHIERLKPKVARLPMRQVDSRIHDLPCMESWRARRYAATQINTPSQFLSAGRLESLK
jgi:hypothetical protein